MNKNIDDNPSDITEAELNLLLNNSTYPNTDRVENSDLSKIFKIPENRQYTYATFSESFEKYKVNVDIIKWLIGTVGLTIITYIINWGFKDREQGLNEIAQYDKYATELIILNDNPVKKRMLAQFFAHVTPSEKLSRGWKIYYEIVDKEYYYFIKNDSIAKSKLLELNNIDTLDLTPAQKAEKIEIQAEVNQNEHIKNAPIIIPEQINVSQKTIYIQSINTSEEYAGKIRLILIAAGYKIPDIEFMDKKRYDNLSTNEIRYFREEDYASVELIRSILDNENIPAKVKFIPRLSAIAQKGSIELWLK